MDWLAQNSHYKPVVLITGCGSGLGLALAELFYQQEQYRVVATARSHSRLFLEKRLKPSDRFMVLSLDVTKESEREALIQQIESTWGGVDILINNAGICYRSVIEHMTEEDEELQMATNYFGPIGLIRLVLPHMRNKGRGKIINISSVSGMLAMPTMASYSASKHALEGASEALWYECKPLGVDVSLIQPGFIRSDSFTKVKYTKFALDAEAYLSPYYDYYKQMTPFIERLMGVSLATPQSISKLVLKVVQRQRPPLWIPATFDAMLFGNLRRMLPRQILLRVLFWALPKSDQWALSYSNRRAPSLKAWIRPVVKFFKRGFLGISETSEFHLLASDEAQENKSHRHSA